jgi:hypothetical protein
MNIAKTRDIARGLGIQPDNLFKTELIKTIQTKEGNFPCYGTALDGNCDQLGCCWRDECFEAARLEKQI